MKSIILICILLLLGQNSFAQVVNSGGGGPEKDDKGNGPSGEHENPHLVEERMKTYEMNLKIWFVKAKKDWKTCSKKSLKAKDILELYTQLNFQEQRKTKMDCEEDEVIKCLFSNDKHNGDLYKIISEKGFHQYLQKKGIDNEESRNQMINYFKEKIKGR